MNRKYIGRIKQSRCMDCGANLHNKKAWYSEDNKRILCKVCKHKEMDNDTASKYRS